MTDDVWLKRFQREVLPRIKTDFTPQKILLFGSRVKGGADTDSDIDVVIVSDAFAGVPFVERMPLILKKIRFQKHIDFICYSPAEFERIKDKSSVLMDALETGEELKL
jgi:uncharacterized protein